MKHFAIILFLFFVALGCKNKSDKTDTALKPKTTLQNIAGNYVSQDYEKRAGGYDWVAVIVDQPNDSSAHISVRSRADKKQPTCFFDVVAIVKDSVTLKSVVQNAIVLFKFENNSINIKTEKTEDKNVLNYYCSGGGSLAGTYHKTDSALDEKQIDQTVFKKTLSLQNISFDISATATGSLTHLTIIPAGLKIDNSAIKMDIYETIANAEIEDLNADGYPEILVYTNSAGSGSYGNVIGYSVNNGKTLSRIYFANIADNPKANKGFMGHDEFAIVESSLVQRFRVYNKTDNNATPTGNVRQIQYKLKDGEASRFFAVDKIVEYPAH